MAMPPVKKCLNKRKLQDFQNEQQKLYIVVVSDGLGQAKCEVSVW